MNRTFTFLKHNAIALAALFIALGGTSYAAVAIPRNSVGRQQLKRGAVGARQLARHAVTERAIKNASVGSHQLRTGSVQRRQLAKGSVSSTKLAAGSVGTAALAPGSVGSGQLGAGSVGPAQLANGSVGPAQLSGGIASYTWAYATIDAAGVVHGSDPAATTQNWSDGSGLVIFQGGLGGDTCAAFSDVPYGSGASTQINSFAGLSPAAGGPGTTGVQVYASPAGVADVTTVVWIECPN